MSSASTTAPSGVARMADQARSEGVQPTARSGASQATRRAAAALTPANRGRRAGRGQWRRHR